MKREKETIVVPAKKMTLRQELKKNYFFYLLALPGVIYLIMFCYIPMAGAYMAFEDYSFKGGMFGSEFVGLRNFKYFFANWDGAWRATKNTLVVNVCGIILGTIMNVLVAIVLGEIRSERYRKTVQTAILFPYFLSWIVIGGIAQTLLDGDTGLINQVITWFGGEPIMFYHTPTYWWLIFVVFSLWKGFGYGSLIYYATLTGFDPCLFEAASIDGAGRWKKMTKITLPLLKPIIAMSLLLSIGGIMGSSMDMAMGLSKMSPLTLEKVDNISTYVYRMGIGNGDFGISSAMGLYQSGIGCLLVLISNLLAKKLNPDYALF